MKALIIEDESALAFSLKKLILDIRPSIQIIGIAPSISESIRLISETPDLHIIFADIRLEDGLSFSIFEKIETRAMIVFTTAYDEYALKSFDYNCLDYLLKPVSKDSLEKAIKKCESFSYRPSSAEVYRVCATILENKTIYRKRLLLERGDEMLVCNVEDICFFIFEEGNSRGFLDDGSWGDVYCPLVELANSLSPDVFFRVNRNTLVNINYIAKLKRHIGRTQSVSMKAPYENMSFPITLERKNRLIKLLSNPSEHENMG